MGTSDTRQAIVRAANAIVQRDGVARLTIEAVAHEAGLSKGGVLYHFPSKDALVVGMVKALIDDFEDDIQHAAADDAERTGRWLRAYVRASCCTDATPLEMQASLIAAIATNPALLEPLRTRYAEWQAQAEADGVPAVTATIIRLAVDGLWLADLFGLAPPTGDLRGRVTEALLDLTRQAKGDD